MVSIRKSAVQARQIELGAALDDKLFDLSLRKRPVTSAKMLYDETLVNLSIPRLLGLMGYLSIRTLCA